MAFIKLVTIILLTETIVLLNCRPRNGNDPIFGNYPATVPSILWNQKYVSRLYCFCFPIYRHFHLTFQDHCHDLFRMTMVWNQTSRFKDHVPHLNCSRNKSLVQIPFSISSAATVLKEWKGLSILHLPEFSWISQENYDHSDFDWEILET